MSSLYLDGILQSTGFYVRPDGVFVSRFRFSGTAVTAFDQTLWDIMGEKRESQWNIIGQIREKNSKRGPNAIFARV